MAKMIGTSYATVNRWENGHSRPGKAAQLRLYDICKEKGINLEELMQAKIDRVVSELKPCPESVVLFHGSISGIKGPIAPISRERCDFGKGFYMATDPYQPLALISDFEGSRLYVIRLELAGLRVLQVRSDIEWAMMVAYHRGKMDEARGTKLYERFSHIADGYDVIIGSIANDQMFYVPGNFYLGNITDQALVMSLSALQPGQQYALITKKACSHAVMEAEIELSYLERVFLRDVSESNRIKGVNLADEICKKYRREGLFFDELLKNG